MSRRAFALIELAIVVVIVAIIFAIALPSLQRAAADAKARAPQDRFTTQEATGLGNYLGVIIHDNATGRDYLSLYERGTVELAPVPAVPAEAKP